MRQITNETGIIEELRIIGSRIDEIILLADTRKFTSNEEKELDLLLVNRKSYKKMLVKIINQKGKI